MEFTTGECSIPDACQRFAFSLFSRHLQVTRVCLDRQAASMKVTGGEMMGGPHGKLKVGGHVFVSPFRPNY